MGRRRLLAGAARRDHPRGPRRHPVHRGRRQRRAGRVGDNNDWPVLSGELRHHRHRRLRRGDLGGGDRSVRRAGRLLELRPPPSTWRAGHDRRQHHATQHLQLLNGTSMATPHVTGAAALAHAITGKTGARLRDAILAAVDPIPALAGRTVTGGRRLGRLVPLPGGPSSNSGEKVLTPLKRPRSSATGRCRPIPPRPVRADAEHEPRSRQGDARTRRARQLRRDDIRRRGRPRLSPLGPRQGRGQQLGERLRPRAVRPGRQRGRRRHLWDRHTGSAEVNLEDCSGCGLSGWGWQDNGYGSGVRGPPLFFATTGPQADQDPERGRTGSPSIRSCCRAAGFVSAAPGGIEERHHDCRQRHAGRWPAAESAEAEVVLYVGRPRWRWRVPGPGPPTPTAAGGARLQNPNAGAPKVTGAFALLPRISSK